MMATIEELSTLSGRVLTAFDARQPQNVLYLLSTFFVSANAKPDEGIWIIVKEAIQYGDRETLEALTEVCIEGFDPNQVQELSFNPPA